MSATASSIAIVCLHCGGKQADPQTGRCQQCGKIAVSPSIASEFSHPTLDHNVGAARHSPSASYRQNGATEAVGSLSTAEPISDPASELRQYFEAQPTLSFALPESRETTAWLSKTKAVRDQLLARADKAETQIAELRSEAERCRATAAAFSSLIGQLSVESTPAAAGAAKPAMVWARTKDGTTYSACIDCGRSDTPHCANGRCRTCDNGWRHPAKTAHV